mgnify:FL=1
MAWTINNGKLYFNSVLYTGNGSTQSITGVGFQPDWVWYKSRSDAYNNGLFDIVRGVDKFLSSNSSGEESTISGIASFNSDGFTVGSDAGSNGSSKTFVGWSWLAAGTAPSNTYVVKVVSDSGNKYRFDDFGTSAVTLEISEGGTFTFDQSDSSNSGHPLRFSTTSNGTHGGGSEYTTGVTTNGTPGQAGAYTRITVAASAPTLYYYCTAHSGMGGQANTPVTNSFSNFAGSIQSNISPNTTSGFSVVTYTGAGSAGTIGHGLNAVPSMYIVKIRSGRTGDWLVYHNAVSAAPQTDFLKLNEANAVADESTIWNDTAPTSSVFSVGTEATVSGNSNTFVAYCFAEKQGYSKFGSYVGNGSADGTFVYTGFKPALFIIKRTDGSNNWMIWDNKRTGFNIDNNELYPNQSAAEGDDDRIDLLSNGIKWRNGGATCNGSGSTYIYMALAENPFTSSTGTPVTAR